MLEFAIREEECHDHRSHRAERFDVSIVGVTGASGYVGRALLAELVAQGHRVVAIGRRSVDAAAEFRHADLGGTVPDGTLSGIDALIHLAANTTGAGGASAEAEIAFAAGLLREAATARCRIVFVSSQAADAGAPSVYGRTKAAIESLVLEQGGIVVRPGMVYGGSADGLYGAMLRLVRASPLIPALVMPRPRVQPIHVDDLALALARLVAKDEGPAIFRLAQAPIEFSRFLAAIGRFQLGKNPVFVPVPTGLLRVLLTIGSKLVDDRFSPDRLDSLTRLPMMDTEADLARLDLRLRDLPSGLSARPARNRALLREAGLLSRATLGTRATPALARRYVRALAALGVPHALQYPRGVGPCLLASMDRPGTRASAAVASLPWRIAVLARLAETEPRLAGRFLKPLSERGRIRAFAALAHAGWLELRSRCLWLVARWMAPRQ